MKTIMEMVMQIIWIIIILKVNLNLVKAVIRRLKEWKIKIVIVIILIIIILIIVIIIQIAIFINNKDNLKKLHQKSL